MYIGLVRGVSMRKTKQILIVILLSIFIGTSFDVSAAGPYTVTFLDWNGKELRVQEVNEGDSAIYFEGFRIGHKFINWNQKLVDISNDMTVYPIYEPIEYNVVFSNYDGTILSSEEIAYDTILNPVDPPPRDGFTFVGWTPESLVVKGEVFYTAVFEETIIENPDVDEDTSVLREIVYIDENEMLISSSILLNAEISNQVLMPKIELINKYTANSKVVFPKLTVTDQEGVAVTIYTDSIIKALKKDISFAVNLDFVDILINSNNLAKAVDINSSSVVLMMKESNITLKTLYNVENTQGEAVGQPFEINYLYDINQEFPVDVIMEVTISPLDEDNLYSGTDPYDVTFVAYDEEFDTYRTISSDYDRVNKSYKMMLSKNSVIIPMKLTTTTTIEVEDFSFIDFVLGFDQYVLYLMGFGLFVVVYVGVYTFEYLRQRK